MGLVVRGGLGAFLTPGWPAAGVALAVLVAGIAGRMAGRAGTVERLVGLVVASLAAGVIGLGVALL